jgi:hypothetical protein
VRRDVGRHAHRDTAEPLISRLGMRAGSTSGSFSEPS